MSANASKEQGGSRLPSDISELSPQEYARFAGNLLVGIMYGDPLEVGKEQHALGLAQTLGDPWESQDTTITVHLPEHVLPRPDETR